MLLKLSIHLLLSSHIFVLFQCVYVTQLGIDLLLQTLSSFGQICRNGGFSKEFVTVNVLSSSLLGRKLMEVNIFPETEQYKSTAVSSLHYPTNSNICIALTYYTEKLLYGTTG